MNETCRLCGANTKLCKSHILPEFLYEPCYDPNHTFLSISTSPDVKTKAVQIGVWEYLLCVACEARLNKYETYTSSLIRKLYERKMPHGFSIVIDEFDYKLLKLFAISILWRCHVSQKMVKGEIQLGPHAEKMRSMILENDPGRPQDYAFFLVKMFGPNPTSMSRIIMPPRSLRIEGMQGYCLVAHGFDWFFTVSSHFNLSSRLPYVGLHEQLLVPVVVRDEREIAHDLRKMFPKEQQAHTDALVERLKQRAEQKRHC